jgi:bacterioferritin-associated ferredoxin
LYIAIIMSTAAAATANHRWSPAEERRLREAVERHGRRWIKVAASVGGGRTPKKCYQKAEGMIAADKLADPGGKHEAPRWTTAEQRRLREAVDTYGRDWAKAAAFVGGGCTPKRCWKKARSMIAADEIADPGGKIAYNLWNSVEQGRLLEAVNMFGRDWAKVAAFVGGGRTRHLCARKVDGLIATGKLAEPGGKVEYITWTPAAECRLREAVERFGRGWAKVTAYVGGDYTSKRCSNKAEALIAAGLIAEPGGKRRRVEWSPEEESRLREAVDKFGREWVKVAAFVGGGHTSAHCTTKVDRTDPTRKKRKTGE